MSETRLGLGFVGGGFVGQIAHLSNYALNEKCELMAIAEVRPGLRQELVKKYSFKKSYAQHTELLADSGVSAVVAVTRRQHTGPVALDTLKAGKHLMTEKPMCHTLAQAKILVDESERRGLIHAVGYMRRHDEGVQTAKKLLDRLFASGELGALNLVKVRCFGGDSYRGSKAPVVTDEPAPEGMPEWPLSPDWLPENRAHDYARFVNVFCHDVNLLRHLSGKHPEVERVNLADPNAGTVEFSLGECQALFACGYAVSAGWDEAFEFIFERGGVRIELPSAFLKNAAATVSLISGHKPEKIPVSASWAFQRQADAFVSDVLAKRAPLASAKDAMLDLALIEEIWKKEISR